MLKGLGDFYSACGIAALDFRCKHAKACGASDGNFISALEAMAGDQYERGVLPRLLFVSLDPKRDISDRDPSHRTTLYLRDWEARQPRSVNGGSEFRRTAHWYQTYEFAHRLLAPVAREKGMAPLSFSDMHRYFAHTNSAKCKNVARGTAQGPASMFRSCSEFIPGEIDALWADVVVTQGAYARDAIAGAFPVLLHGEHLNGKYACEVVKVGKHPVLKFVMPHPAVHDNSYRDTVAEAWPWYLKVGKSFCLHGVDSLAALGLRGT